MKKYSPNNLPKRILLVLFFTLPLVLLMGLGLSAVSSGSGLDASLEVFASKDIDINLGSYNGAQVHQIDGPEVRMATHDQTGKLTFLGVSPASPITVPGVHQEELNAQDRGLAYLNIYGVDFGLKDPGQELLMMKVSQDPDRRTSVRYQQVYKGVPILAGELIVNTDSVGRLLSISGEISPDLSLSTTPSLTAAEASAIARAGVAKWYGLDEAGLETTEPELWIYDERLLRWSERPQELVWRITVTPVELGPIRELVLVEAQRGGVSLHFNQIDTAKNRETYDANNTTTLPGTLVCNEADPNCTGAGGDTDAVNAHVYAGDTYDFYISNHGRDSIDNAGMTLISTVHFDTGFCNAFWNGLQMVYGDDCFIVVDDVVGHELTHGVTGSESDLFYYYQSGAINESFSDIWGEFVDLGNGSGDDTPGVRWLIGEDASIPPLRNMKDPTALGDPDKMTSIYYYPGALDNGGVHINSGINNKAAYLMVDGDTFNGQTVTGLGVTKVAKIYYEVQTNLLTSGSDYADLYNALYQGCLNLVGTSGITAADCQEVRDATDAVEMNLEPSPGFNPEAPICSVGQLPNDIFFDDMEGGSGNWTFGALTGTSRWQYDSPYGGFAHSGIHFLYADDFPAAITDAYAAMNADVSVPANAYLHFAHAFDFEAPDYDGGILQYSTNSGASWSDASALFDSNGYNGAINPSFGNPLAGRPGFVGPSHGYISSRLDLSSLAGGNVRFRWRMGLDDINYSWGWWLDDVRIYTCGEATPTATSTNIPTITPTITPTPSVTLTPTPTITPTPITHTPTPTITPTPITPTPTPTPTATASITHTPTSTPPSNIRSWLPLIIRTDSSNLIINGGFEEYGSWSLEPTEYTASYSTAQAYNGYRSVRTGIVNPGDNVYSYSSAWQQVYIPSNAGCAKLRFWLYPMSTETGALILPTELLDINLPEAGSASEAQMVLILDPVTDHVLQALQMMRSDAREWTGYQFDLMAYSGSRIKLYFGTLNNGTGGVTSMYVDDVSLTVCTN